MAKRRSADEVPGIKLTVNLSGKQAARLKKNAADAGVTQADAVRGLANLRLFKAVFGESVKRRIDRNERRSADQQSIDE